MLRRASSLLLAVSTGATLGCLLLLHGDLPDRVPTHFDTAGNANGWSSREGFEFAIAGLSIVLLAVFGGLGALIERLPVQLVNLPHRDHWLAPERRRTTLASLRARLEVLGAATQALVLGIALHCAGASRAPAPASVLETWGLIGGYFAFVAGWLVALHRRFARPGGTMQPVRREGLPPSRRGPTIPGP